MADPLHNPFFIDWGGGSFSGATKRRADTQRAAQPEGGAGVHSLQKSSAMPSTYSPHFFRIPPLRARVTRTNKPLLITQTTEKPNPPTHILFTPGVAATIKLLFLATKNNDSLLQRFFFAALQAAKTHQFCPSDHLFSPSASSSSPPPPGPESETYHFIVDTGLPIRAGADPWPPGWRGRARESGALLRNFKSWEF